jgi:hypothetical protein
MSATVLSPEEKVKKVSFQKPVEPETAASSESGLSSSETLVVDSPASEPVPTSLKAKAPVLTPPLISELSGVSNEHFKAEPTKTLYVRDDETNRTLLGYVIQEKYTVGNLESLIELKQALSAKVSPEAVVGGSSFFQNFDELIERERLVMSPADDKMIDLREKYNQIKNHQMFSAYVQDLSEELGKPKEKLVRNPWGHGEIYRSAVLILDLIDMLQIERNEELVKQLLKEAGYPNAESIDFSYLNVKTSAHPSSSVSLEPSRDLPKLDQTFPIEIIFYQPVPNDGIERETLMQQSVFQGPFFPKITLNSDSKDLARPFVGFSLISEKVSREKFMSYNFLREQGVIKQDAKFCLGLQLDDGTFLDSIFVPITEFDGVPREVTLIAKGTGTTHEEVINLTDDFFNKVNVDGVTYINCDVLFFKAHFEVENFFSANVTQKFVGDVDDAFFDHAGILNLNCRIPIVVNGQHYYHRDCFYPRGFSNFKKVCEIFISHFPVEERGKVLAKLENMRFESTQGDYINTSVFKKCLEQFDEGFDVLFFFLSESLRQEEIDHLFSLNLSSAYDYLKTCGFISDLGELSNFEKYAVNFNNPIIFSDCFIKDSVKNFLSTPCDPVKNSGSKFVFSLLMKFDANKVSQYFVHVKDKATQIAAFSRLMKHIDLDKPFICLNPNDPEKILEELGGPSVLYLLENPPFYINNSNEVVLNLRYEILLRFLGFDNVNDIFLDIYGTPIKGQKFVHRIRNDGSLIACSRKHNVSTDFEPVSLPEKYVFKGSGELEQHFSDRYNLENVEFPLTLTRQKAFEYLKSKGFVRSDVEYDDNFLLIPLDVQGNSGDPITYYKSFVNFSYFEELCEKIGIRKELVFDGLAISFERLADFILLYEARHNKTLCFDFLNSDKCELKISDGVDSNYVCELKISDGVDSNYVKVVKFSKKTSLQQEIDLSQDSSARVDSEFQPTDISEPSEILSQQEGLESSLDDRLDTLPPVVNPGELVTIETLSTEPSAAVQPPIVEPKPSPIAPPGPAKPAPSAPAAAAKPPESVVKPAGIPAALAAASPKPVVPLTSIPQPVAVVQSTSPESSTPGAKPASTPPKPPTASPAKLAAASPPPDRVKVRLGIFESQDEVGSEEFIDSHSSNSKLLGVSSGALPEKSKNTVVNVVSVRQPRSGKSRSKPR